MRKGQENHAWIYLKEKVISCILGAGSWGLHSHYWLWEVVL